MSIEIKLEGAERLSAKFAKGVKDPSARGIVRATLFMEREARRNLTNVVYNRSVPWVRTGKARQSIIGQNVSAGVGRVFMGVKYGRFIEEGTKPRTIVAKKKSLVIPVKRLNSIAGWMTNRMSKDRKFVFLGKRVNHPGTKARPFWKPAVEATRKEAPKLILNEIQKSLK